MAKSIKAQGGFSLIEILITLALVTLLSVAALNALMPWLAFKQTLDTDRKLQDMRSTLETAYAANSMSIDIQTGATFLGLTHDPATAGNSCGTAANLDALGQPALSAYLKESAISSSNDGFALPLCFFVSPLLSRDVEGAKIYYHTIAIVSTGKNGTLDVGTSFDSTTGQLTLADGGDDRGVVLSGYAIQYAKYRDTLDRMNRVASLYESYFTTRFLNTADRDVSRDYFYSGGTGGDSGGAVPATSGWTPVSTLFSAALGVSAGESTSAFEQLSGPLATVYTNNIEVANYGEQIVVNGQTTRVRSPATLGTGATPPYTALLRAKLPGPADNYVVRAVVGNY
jgi:prepilin-type N-terminal cleavage/methylation domain-containing protein